MPSPLIFITGATGFIGAHVLLQALSAGYRMRLSVRKESQIAPLKALAGTHASNMDFTNIPDLTVPGAFDKALNGVSYIFHIASPMPGKGTDFRMEYLAPAVDGTLALLNAAKNVSSIKRVIIVSSALALISYEDFASGTFHVIEGTKVTIDPESTSFPDDNPGKKYHASKVLAHQSTRSWVAETKPRFSVITLHPSFVFGPNLTQTSPEGLDGTNAMLMGCLMSPKPLIPMSAVDVRDVALAHVKALNVELGSGTGEVHEFLLSAGEEEGWTWENVVSFVKEKFSGVDVKLEGPFDGVATGDTRRVRDVLGIKWRAMEDTVGEFLGQQMRLRAKV